MSLPGPWQIAVSPQANAVAEDISRRRPGAQMFVASLALELGILFALSILFPFLIHILPVPDDARLGARLLPIFYAPLLAALLGRKTTALAVALFAPWMNWAITSHPSPPTATITTLQLLVFVTAIHLAMARVGQRWFLALPAYVLGLLAAVILASAAPGLISHRPVVGWAIQTLTIGMPGIAILTLINWLVVRNYPSGPHGPAAA